MTNSKTINIYYIVYRVFHIDCPYLSRFGPNKEVHVFHEKQVFLLP